ncbi:MAG: cysteine ABC transporter substrate-binding protein [Deltaproteobacteria bacterium]|jgi:polar amino acid transport system substrate-binding protein|nr:cysteine ABC transporter substrate-binding protein [Deltaproteobacteria bacterium]
MKRSLLPLLALATLLAATLTADKLWAGDLADLKAAGKIRIAIFGDKPPFGYVDEYGVPQGYDVFLARRIGKDLLGSDEKIEYVLVEAASRIEVLLANKADLVLANFTVTEERAQQVDFAKPYMKVALGVTSPKTAPITKVEQLKGKTLIVTKGTTADFYFTKNHPEIKLLKFDQNTEAFNALVDGRGAGLAHDNTFLFAWVKYDDRFVTGIDFLGSEDTIAPAIKKDRPELLAWLNEEIVKLTKDKFFEEAYKSTLAPAFGPAVDPKTVLIENLN